MGSKILSVAPIASTGDFPGVLPGRLVICPQSIPENEWNSQMQSASSLLFQKEQGLLTLEEGRPLSPGRLCD